MTTKPLTSLFSAAVCTVAFAAPIALSSNVSAQCPGGAVACADVSVSASVSASASVSVGTRRRAQVAPPPPPPPRGRVLVVQPAPPAPPPGQVVVVQRQPPPPPVQEQVVIIEQDAPDVRLGRRPRLGLTARLGGIVADNVRMGGVSAGIRFRPSRIFGVELSIGAYGGSDYYDRERLEVPLAFDFMFHFPRASRFQVYVLAGSHFSWAQADGFDPVLGRDLVRSYTYFGGQAGIGGELRLSDRFAMSADVRGFIRTRIDEGLEPEFRNAATGEETDTSAGAIFNLGAHFYF